MLAPRHPRTTRTARRAPRAAAAVAVLALLAPACGGGDEPAQAEVTTPGGASPTETTADGQDQAMAFEGTPPTDLTVEQLAPPTDEGSAVAAAGDIVLVHYTGRSWSTGEVFDSSLGRDPIEFTLGTGQVIPGWDQGIAGLRVGQQARLIIPPDLAYGESGIPGVIAPDETLVFDVELVEIVTP